MIPIAKICAVRLDDRLIHGQTSTQWAQFLGNNRILIIDNKIAKDDFQKTILSYAAPPGIKVDILTVDDAVKRWQEDQLGQGIIFVLFKDVFMIRDAVSAGFQFDTLIIGQLAKTGNRKRVLKQIGFTLEEAKAILQVQDAGVKVIYQMLVTDNPVNFDEYLKPVFPELFSN